MRSKPRYWAGVDGEGVGRSPHRYVLLARVDAMGRRSKVSDPDGLTTRQCLDFLVEAPSDCRQCGYYFGYDWTMILRDLPNRDIYRLLRPELRVLPRDEGGGFSRVCWRDYKLHYLAGMMRIQRGTRGATVWDVGRFFQAPFVDSLENWKAAPQEAIDRIRRMKEQRSEFAELNDEITDYCLEECEYLASLITAVEQAHIDIGLRPNSWHGPGSSAGVALRAMGIGEKRGHPPLAAPEGVRRRATAAGEIPPAVEDAAARAFFGGRFEQNRIGRVDAVHGYDIASAYPFQAYHLPCLEHGKWRRVLKPSGLRGARHAVVRYKLQDVGADVPWGPLPCRLPSGNIVFPRGGCKGWVWLPEWEIAQNWKGVEWGGEAWVLHTDCDCRPFERVLAWYRERVALGKSAKGRVLKLILNSIYGKLAQAVGKPKFGSRIWAGMITSGTRAHLLSLALAHSSLDNVVAVATDGLYSTEYIPPERLPMPLAPDTLGSWEHEEHGRMVFVRPGIYWSEDDDTLRARGVGRKHLKEHRGKVLETIERGEARADLGSSIVFGGARACIYNPDDIKRSVHYGEWHPIPARINMTPLPKRNPDWSLRMLDGIDSAPYSTKTLSDDARGLKLIQEVFWGSRD